MGYARAIVISTWFIAFVINNSEPWQRASECNARDTKFSRQLLNLLIEGCSVREQRYLCFTTTNVGLRTLTELSPGRVARREGGRGEERGLITIFFISLFFRSNTGHCQLSTRVFAIPTHPLHYVMKKRSTEKVACGCQAFELRRDRNFCFGISLIALTSFWSPEVTLTFESCVQNLALWQ